MIRSSGDLSLPRRGLDRLARGTFQSYYQAMSAPMFDTKALIELCRENDVAKLGVFGSMARGEANAQSDIDLLVEFSKRKSLLALVSLERKMSTALGRKVDLLTEAAISPYLRDRIKRDLRVIYEARLSEMSRRSTYAKAIKD